MGGSPLRGRAARHLGGGIQTRVSGRQCPRKTTRRPRHLVQL